MLINPDTNDSQAVALDLLHGMSEADPKFRDMLREFGSSLDEGEIRYWYSKDPERRGTLRTGTISTKKLR